MKISTRGRYALLMLLDLAEHKSEGYVSLKDIADRRQISKKYLEQIGSLLSHSNILRANRGYQGGYMLAQSPERYTIGQILRITEGSLCPTACAEGNPAVCEQSDECKTLPIWQGLNNLINEYLDGITLDEVSKQVSKNANDDYSI
ncbi:Rrf2 family transcriptional regulator [Deferribacterales bacterium RsTz2092]|nr:AsnC family transcriptional regulator [Deferribacterales bacterium]